jgi:hypothetical protein
MCRGYQKGDQNHTPDTPIRTAVNDISRPIPQNNTIEANGLLLDLSDEALDAGSNEEIRIIFAISGSPISGLKKPSLLGVFAPTTKVQYVGPVSRNTSPR